jgi:hypothetical protein
MNECFMIDWSHLRHAYGEASDLAELLAGLSPDCSFEQWNELWSRVCHQGTVYSASFHVLPILLSYAQSWASHQRLKPLSLAGAIVASDDRLGVDPNEVKAFEPTIEALHRLALDTLAANDFPGEKLLELFWTIYDLERDSLWGYILDGLVVSGEILGQCTSCGVELYLVIGEEGFFNSADEWATQPNAKRIPILPAEPQSLSGRGEWLYQQALQREQTQAAFWICHLFGTTHCSRCTSSLHVFETIQGHRC